MKEEGRFIQRNPDRLGNFMNSSKSKNNVLYLARHNSAQQYMLWADRLKKSLAGEDLARQEVEHEPAAGS